MKSNLQKIIKNKVREIVKEELKGMKTLSPTVTFLQERLSEGQKSNLSVQQSIRLNCNKLEFQQDAMNQSCRTCLKNPCKKDETQEKALEKVEELIHKAEVDIPKSKIDRVHRNEPKKVKRKQLLRSSQHLDIPVCYTEQDKK